MAKFSKISLLALVVMTVANIETISGRKLSTTLKLSSAKRVPEKIFSPSSSSTVDPNLRKKRQSMAYRFSDGIEYVVPEIHEVFSCDNREYGYYADVANNCQIFHVCNPPEQQFSFFCPNQTIFDQRLLICQDQYTATPCQEAERYYVINQNFGELDQDKLVQV